MNALESPWVLDDLTQLVGEIGDRLDVVMVPKVEGPWDIHYVDRLLAQLEARAQLQRPILVHAILETAQGVANVEEIATATPADAGHEPRAGRPRGEPADEDHPRGRRPPRLSRRRRPEGDASPHRRPAGPLALHARPHGRRLRGRRHPPFYGPFGDIRDLEGCEAQFRAAYLMGCVGAWSLHPAQIDVARRVFSPDPDEVKFAKKVIEAIPTAPAST